MFALTTPPLEAMARLNALAMDEDQYQTDVLQARMYHEGQQFVHLTARLREFLGGDTVNTSEDFRRLRLNVCRIVTNAVVERLLVNNFDSDETGTAEVAPDGSARLVKPVADWAWKVWRANRMEGAQRRVHEAGVRDSEAFVIVDWDNANRRPRFTPHLRYVDQSVTFGSSADVGEGCKAFYRNDDPDQDLLYVTKRWTEVFYSGVVRQERQRLTVYYPERIEKYAGFPGAWRHWQDADDPAWPIPWLHRDGSPLGIPVAHFRSGAGMEAREAWPLQNAINKELVDLMTASDMTAFRVFLAFGWTPTDASGNPLEISPGRWLGSPTKDARGEAVDGADMSNFLNVIEALIFNVAMVTDTPVSRFTTTKQVAAEGSQKQMDGPLVNKVRARQYDLGDGWEQCMNIARRLENRFGAGGLDEAVQLYAGWEPAEVRDQDAEIARAQKLIALGIPFVEVATGLGYDHAKVQMWDEARKAEQEAERQAMAQQTVVAAGRLAN